MACLLLILVEMSLLAAWAKRKLAREPERELIAYLRAVEEAARGGRPFAARSCLSTTGATLAVSRVLRRGEDLGRPLVPSIVALRRELARTTAQARDSRRLWRLVQGRALLVTAMALTARLGCEWSKTGSVSITSRGPEDVAALCLAAILLAVGQLWIIKALPSPWLVGDRSVSALGLAWLRSHLHAEPVPDGPVASALGDLRRRQCLSGVSLQGEMRSLLVDWAKCQSSQVRERLTKVEDALPLLELTTSGIPAALILLMPLLAGFG